MEVLNLGDAELEAKVKEWLLWDKYEVTRRKIQELTDKKDVEELKNRLLQRMSFGTAGLRAPMGAGNSQMNDLTIIQTSQGFAEYMLTATPQVTDKGVVIGYDARHNSQRFAQRAACIFISKNIPVYLFSQICPTPYVAYAVTKLGCSWGIMVTASHNPKEDNGYKVYYENGAQIVSPHDQGISAAIQVNLAPWPASWDLTAAMDTPLCTDPLMQIHTAYQEELQKLCYYKSENEACNLRFTYTAMHGVGTSFVEEAFKTFGLCPFVGVQQQVDPDPDFPTVRFPNPEEGASALDLSIHTADAAGSRVILANDPDADRLAVAERQGDLAWKVFSGNEVGALLGWWLWTCHTQRPNAAPASDCYFLASTVSSKILRAIAAKEGCNFIETLTGFKWMGNKSRELMDAGKTVIFAFEEAIGFMCGTTVLDKDGVSAAAVAAEMTGFLHRNGLTLNQQLENIYNTYGHHISSNSYFICHNPVTIKQMFERIRNYKGSGKYPDSLGDFPIKYIRDLTTGYDNEQPDGKAILPVSKTSEMITFTFENGCVATIRTSGTEPKVKYYSEFCASPGQSRASVEADLERVVSAIITHFYEPERNGLIARK